MTDTVRPPRWRRHPDPRDRLIIALYAQLEAERQTRETLRWAIRNGALKPEVLEAIAGDPVPRGLRGHRGSGTNAVGATGRYVRGAPQGAVELRLPPCFK